MALNKWPPPRQYFDKDKSYILVTWDDLYTDDNRGLRFQTFMSYLRDETMWEYYFPDYAGDSYGALYTCSDSEMYLSEVAYLDRIRANKTMLFSSMECRPSRHVTKPATANTVDAVQKANAPGEKRSKSRKKQQQLTNKGGGKRKYSAAQLKKFDVERQKRREEGRINDAIYDRRMAEDEEFADREKRRKLAEKERRQIVIKKKKAAVEHDEIFGMVFGDGNYEQKWREHRFMFGTNYMSLGDGKFFNMDDFSIKGKEDLYEYNDVGVRVPIKRSGILRDMDLIFAEGETLPKYDDYDCWYRSLPIHIGFVTDEDRKDIYYMAPKEDQPNYPFVCISWMIDNEESSCNSFDSDEDVSSEEEYSSYNSKTKAWGEKKAASSSDDYEADEIPGKAKSSMEKTDHGDTGWCEKGSEKDEGVCGTDDSSDEEIQIKRHSKSAPKANTRVIFGGSDDEYQE